MKHFFSAFFALTFFIALTAFSILITAWNIDPNYNIKFSGHGASGTFTGLKGTVDFNPNALSASNIAVSVDAASIQTGNNKKNEHAKGEGWFNVVQYPVITFTSSQFSKQADKFLVKGTLELHGVNKEVEIPFTFNNNVFEGSFKINRKDFAIKGSGPSFMVGSEFEISLKVPVIKK